MREYTAEFGLGGACVNYPQVLGQGDEVGLDDEGGGWFVKNRLEPHRGESSVFSGQRSDPADGVNGEPARLEGPVDAVLGIALPAVEEVVQDKEAPDGLQVGTFPTNGVSGLCADMTRSSHVNIMSPEPLRDHWSVAKIAMALEQS